MSLLAMPFLVINYGGEMIYILEQRLHSQQIKAEKAQKVLHDLTRALFNDVFIEELLRPQALYSFTQTREVCDKLAQSSIMKLSTDSMDKLFDLVVMGVKYQTLSVRHPCGLIDMTLNHIDYIAALVKQSATSTTTIAKARENFCKFARELSVAEYAQIRMTLLDFAVQKRVKVSLFLQEKMQHTDGRFVIPTGGPLANEVLVRVPGTVEYEGGYSEKFAYPLADLLQPKLTGDPYDPASRDSTLGANLYTIDRKRRQSQQSGDAGKKDEKSSCAAPAAGSSNKAAAVRGSSYIGGSGTGGSAELGHLSTLLGVAAPSSASGGAFRLNLFEGRGDTDSGGGGGGTQEICIPRMTREELEKCNKELVSVMAGMDLGGGAGDDLTVPEDDDLLALMDGAGAD